MQPEYDLTASEAHAHEAARHFGVTLEPPFAMSNVSYVAPAGDLVVKVPWPGDDESLHEAEALELWAGDGAVRLKATYGRALLEERAVPGDDISPLPEADATAVAVALAARLWRPARAPFRPVLPHVERWLDEAERTGYALVPRARELLHELRDGSEWIVHGDFHHHNILRHGDRWVAVDPKPYAADREYDVPSFLWNPIDNGFDDRAQTDVRIAAFAALGLDELRIRAWTIVRGAYLRPELADRIRTLL